MIPGGIRGGKLPARVPYPWPAYLLSMGETIVADLVHCIETGENPRCAGINGREALEVALALRESQLKGGRRIDLPLADRALTMLSRDLQHDDVPARIRRQNGV